MVELRFSSANRPFALASTRPERLNTIYIPINVLEDATYYFQREYNLPPEQAQRAAEVFIEELYPETLGHEVAHLVLGRIAKKEGLPIGRTMAAYHNPVVKRLEAQSINRAIRRALKQSEDMGRNTCVRKDLCARTARNE